MDADQILLSPPDVGEAEVQAVVAAMRSGWIAPAGPDLTAFEAEVADRLGRSYAVGLSSGTAALHLALVSWGVGKGDVVLTSTLTFAATVNAIAYTGATPHLIDCEQGSANIDPNLVEEAIDTCRKRGERVRAIVPVDMLGKCADYDAIEKIAAANDLLVLSDAAESLGASRSGRLAGSVGDAAVLSFNGNKIMTTSGGGMLLTDDERLADHVRFLSTQAREPVDHYEHHEIGYNYRLSNILAALGRAQLRRLDEMIQRRRHWRSRYREMVAAWDGVGIIGGEEDAEDNCWLTAIRIDPERAAADRHRVSAHLRGRGIETRPVWKPMHLQPVHATAPRTLNGTSERLFDQGLTLPSGSAMTESSFDRVSDALSSVMQR